MAWEEIYKASESKGEDAQKSTRMMKLQSGAISKKQESRQRPNCQDAENTTRAY